MNDLNFIIGLMAQNTDALGFIPSSTIEHQYINNQRYIIQSPGGHSVGYLLHGKPTPGGILTIPQACIDFDFREQGHGMDVLQVVIDRAKRANCRVVKARVAAELPANQFWQHAGFEVVNVLHPENRRNRAINVYILDLWPRLIK